MISIWVHGEHFTLAGKRRKKEEEAGKKVKRS